MYDYNNTPLPDFEGFTPSQMHKIIYNPFDEDCPIRINIPAKEILLSKSPIMKIIVDLLLILKSGKIKLTQTGNLPPKIIKDIYAKKYLPDEHIEDGIIKLRTETDWIVIHSAKLVLSMAGLIRKEHNFLYLTKKCVSLLNKDSYSEIFYEFLKTFALNFRWGYNDGFQDADLGQIGFLYSLFLLNKYGKEKRDIKYYADLYFLAFPSFLQYSSENHSMKELAYHTRFIERFALWFGFVEEDIEGEKFFEPDIKVKSTKLLEQLFNI